MKLGWTWGLPDLCVQVQASVGATGTNGACPAKSGTTASNAKKKTGNLRMRGFLQSVSGP